jgi:hypothetical protein
LLPVVGCITNAVISRSGPAQRRSLRLLAAAANTLGHATQAVVRHAATARGPRRAGERGTRRQALPKNLERVEHHHEPADTTCPSPGCAQPKQRVGQDVSEKLDINARPI